MGRQAIPGESLNLLIGSRPFKDDEGSDRVKLAVMDYLNQKYHIVEEDFISAELEVVPAFKAADIGFDRSLIGAYGHDDRVCGFACLAALLAWAPRQDRRLYAGGQGGDRLGRRQRHEIRSL